MTTTTLVNSKVGLYGSTTSQSSASKESSTNGFDSILKQQSATVDDVDFDFENKKEIESTSKDNNSYDYTKAEQSNTVSKSSESNKQETNNSDSNVDQFNVEKQGNETVEMLDEEDMIGYAESMIATLLQNISEVLDVSVLDVSQMLETMGLEVTDLLDSGTLTDFVLSVSGAEDVLELTTNQELYTQLQEVTEVIQEVVQEIEQSEYDVEGITKLLEQSDVEIITNQLSDNVDEVVMDDEAVEQNTLGKNSIIAEDGLDNVEIKITKNSQPSSEQGYTEQNADNYNFLNSNNPTVAMSAEGNIEGSTFTTAQSNEIMNQLLEQMTTNLKAQVTELEMQLNPESLGKVNIHLVAEEGAITAKFTAESELVKAVLENQMIQLKENFAQQGLKVTAVEVAVEYQAFQENKQQDEEPKSDESKKGRLKTLNIEELDGELEVYSEEEQLAVQIMQDNGNSIDYVV